MCISIIILFIYIKDRIERQVLKMLHIGSQPYVTPTSAYNSTVRTVNRTERVHRTENYTTRYNTETPRLKHHAAAQAANEPGLLIDVFG